MQGMKKFLTPEDYSSKKRDAIHISGFSFDPFYQLLTMHNGG